MIYLNDRKRSRIRAEMAILDAQRFRTPTEHNKASVYEADAKYRELQSLLKAGRVEI